MARLARACNCDRPHPQTGTRAGVPISRWSCPEHGNLFMEYAEPATSTPHIQKRIAEAILLVGKDVPRISEFINISQACIRINLREMKL